jgi:hypothetical protein
MQTKLFLDGQWVAPKCGYRFDVVDPANDDGPWG